MTAAALVLAACGSAAVSRVVAHDSGKPELWAAFVHVNDPLDLAGPRHNGSLVLEAAGRLWLLGPAGQVQPFAPEYMVPIGRRATSEPYITQSSGGCFGNQRVYALRLTKGPGVVAITPRAVRRLVRITTTGVLDGITFDQTGKVRSPAAGDNHRCGKDHRRRHRMPRLNHHGDSQCTTLEGGMAVAPSTFAASPVT